MELVDLVILLPATDKSVTVLCCLMVGNGLNICDFCGVLADFFCVWSAGFVCFSGVLFPNNGQVVLLSYFVFKMLFKGLFLSLSIFGS